MPKGSVLVWVGSLWHGGGANRTDERRVGIAMNYCAGYIRQQENQQLGVPPALVKTFPRRLQELVGYSVYNGLVGHIDKKHPAKVVLAENEGVDMVWDLLEDLSSSRSGRWRQDRRRDRPHVVAWVDRDHPLRTSASRRSPAVHWRCQHDLVGVQSAQVGTPAAPRWRSGQREEHLDGRDGVRRRIVARVPRSTP